MKTSLVKTGQSFPKPDSVFLILNQTATVLQCRLNRVRKALWQEDFGWWTQAVKVCTRRADGRGQDLSELSKRVGGSGQCGVNSSNGTASACWWLFGRFIYNQKVALRLKSLT